MGVKFIAHESIGCRQWAIEKEIYTGAVKILKITASVMSVLIPSID